MYSTHWTFSYIIFIFQPREEAEKAEKERIEVEKLAKAPIKKQMSAWVNSFELPTTKIQNEKVDLIKQKFEAFKNWSLKEIEGL